MTTSVLMSRGIFDKSLDGLVHTFYYVTTSTGHLGVPYLLALSQNRPVKLANL